MNYLLHGLQSARLTFRALEHSDFNTWLTFFQDPESNRYWSTKDLDAEALCQRWFERNLKRNEGNHGMNVLIERSTGEFVGQAGLLLQTVDDEEELEVGYSIMPNFRNKGYATEASAKCLDHAFANRFRDSVISIIHVDNRPSELVARKNGMRVTKQTTYHGNPVNIFRISPDQKAK